MLNSTSLAAGVAAGAKNTVFQAGANVLARKLLVIATHDPALTGVVPNVPVLITSAADAGDQFGFGFMAHRLALYAEVGARGIPTYVLPLEEAGGAVVAAGTITVTVTTAEAGTINLYVAGERVPVTVSAGDTDAAIAAAIAAAITAKTGLPVTGAATLAVVDVEAKSKGPWGNEITIQTNLAFGEEGPAGVTLAVADMASGAGVPDVGAALDAGLGTGTNANGIHITDVVHGFLQDTTTLDDLSTYNGVGNDFTGLYDKLVARPFRVLTGDTAAGSGGLTALIAVADARLLDRTNGVIAVPGSANHPSEIAAQAIGIMARINNVRAEQPYFGEVLAGVFAGAVADRWTADYDDRDTAVKSGVSPTDVQTGAVVLQNVVSFYRPASVPVESNGYRSMRNISITQNILSSVVVTFSAEPWVGISIVADVTRVTNVTSKAKARDTTAVRDALVALALSWEGLAWLFSAAFTLESLKAAGAVSIRSGGTGFDSTVKVIYSGEGGILNTEVLFDTSLAVVIGG